MAAIYTTVIDISSKPILTTFVVGTINNYIVPNITLDSANSNLEQEVEDALNNSLPAGAGLVTVTLVGEELTVVSDCTAFDLNKIVAEVQNNEFTYTVVTPNPPDSAARLGVLLNDATALLQPGDVYTVSFFNEDISYEIQLGDTVTDFYDALYGLIIAYQAANPSSAWLSVDPTIVSGSGKYSILLTMNNSERITDGLEVSYAPIDSAHDFTGERCTEVEVGVELTFDCADLSGITFKDTTKEYSPTNTGGYGEPNYPAISDILSVDFILTDANQVEWVFANSGYLPNAAGTSSIRLNGDNFVNDDDTLEFIHGATYTLTYRLHVGSSSTVDTSDEFVFPCCGEDRISDLAIGFSIEEQIGCTSIKFEDTTGVYNSDNNTGGYGSPNPEYADIIRTEITFTKNDGNVVTITDFIPTEETPYIIINSETLGYGDSAIPSQVMAITYSVFVTGNCRVGYVADKVLFRCQLENCIAAQAAAVLGDCDVAKVDSVMAMIWKYNQLVITSRGNIECVIGEAEKLYKKCSQNCPPCN